MLLKVVTHVSCHLFSLPDYMNLMNMTYSVSGSLLMVYLHNGIHTHNHTHMYTLAISLPLGAYSPCKYTPFTVGTCFVCGGGRSKDILKEIWAITLSAPLILAACGKQFDHKNSDFFMQSSSAARQMKNLFCAGWISSLIYKEKAPKANNGTQGTIQSEE